AWLEPELPPSPPPPSLPDDPELPEEPDDPELPEDPDDPELPDEPELPELPLEPELDGAPPSPPVFVELTLHAAANAESARTETTGTRPFSPGLWRSGAVTCRPLPPSRTRPTARVCVVPPPTRPATVTLLPERGASSEAPHPTARREEATIEKSPSNRDCV